ncbi:hypothetical protein ACLOJK_027563 [Asimina triloba]
MLDFDGVGEDAARRREGGGLLVGWLVGVAGWGWTSVMGGCRWRRTGCCSLSGVLIGVSVWHHHGSAAGLIERDGRMGVDGAW